MKSFKKRINLLQADLVPEKRYLTLATVMIVWGAVAIVMLGLYGVVSVKHKSIDAQVKTLSILNASQKNTLKEMESLLSSRTEDPALLAELDQLKYVLKHKNHLKDRLSAKDNTQFIGYSSVLTELAKYHHKDIQLQQAHISANQVTLEGVSKHASAVPQWLTNFEDASFLTGKMFVGFRLSENQDRSTQFAVSTLPLTGENQ